MNFLFGWARGRSKALNANRQDVLKQYGGHEGIQSALVQEESKNTLAKRLMLIGIVSLLTITVLFVSTHVPADNHTSEQDTGFASLLDGTVIASEEQGKKIDKTLKDIVNGDTLIDNVSNGLINILGDSVEDKDALRVKIKTTINNLKETFQQNKVTGMLWQGGVILLGSMVLFALIWKVFVINAMLGFLRFFVEHNGKKHAAENMKFLPQIDLISIVPTIKRYMGLALSKDARNMAYTTTLQAYTRLVKRITSLQENLELKKFWDENDMIVNPFINRLMKELKSHQVSHNIVLTKIGELENQRSTLEDNISSLKLEISLTDDKKQKAAFKKKIKSRSKSLKKVESQLSEGFMSYLVTKAWGWLEGMQHSHFMWLIPAAYFANEIGHFTDFTEWGKTLTWSMSILMGTMLSIYASGKFIYSDLYKAPELFDLYKIALERNDPDIIRATKENLLKLHIRQLIRYALEEERAIIPTYNMAQMATSTVEMSLVIDGLDEGIVSHKDSVLDNAIEQTFIMNESKANLQQPKWKRGRLAQ